MNDREKFLAVAVAAMVALWGASQGWTKYQTALDKNLNTQRSVAQELSTTRTATARGRRAQQKLRKWQRQSLPTDADIAKSLYQDWLQQQLTSAGLKVKELNIRSPRASSANYRQFTFKINATGKLKQLTEFLYGFYQAKHLHRISQATLSPTKGRKSLEISLTVDALSLAEAKRADQLADGTSDPFQQSLAQFRDSIVGRNLFATDRVAKPATKAAEVAEMVETETEDNEAARANFSGLNYGQKGWLMSVRMKDSGKVLYFRVGDTIDIGQFQGTVQQFDGARRRVIVSSETGQVQVRLGQTLAEAEPLGENAI